MRKNQQFYGFTIVELLVVIVVIGVLAAITIVSYSGISNKADVTSLKSDLSNGSKQLSIFEVDKGAYPASNNCSNPSNNEICLKPSNGNEYIYSSLSPYTTYILIARNIKSGVRYYTEPQSEPQEYSPASGGVVSDNGGYRTHTFNSNGTLIVRMSISAEVSISAGGGGGGGGSCGNPIAGSGINGGNSSIVYSSVTYTTYGGGGGTGAGDYSDGSPGSNGGTSNPSGWTITTASNGGSAGDGGEGMGGTGGSGGKLTKNNFNLVGSQNMTVNVGSGGAGGSGTGSCGWASGNSGGTGGSGVVTVRYLF